MARLSGPQRRRKKALEAAEKSWSKRMKSKTNTTDEFVSKTNRRGRKTKVKNPNYRPPTAKDKSDAKKESELEGVLKNKPKGGYKDTSTKPKKKNKLKPAPWGRNDDGSPKKQPSASSQIATHKKSVAKAKAKEKGKVEREENEWGPGGQPSASKQIAAKKKSTPKKSNVFTRHYKTGKELGVMTRSQRRAYDKEAHEAGGKSYEERVTAHEKETGHGKKHKRETLYNAAQRKKKNKK